MGRLQLGAEGIKGDVVACGQGCSKAQSPPFILMSDPVSCRKIPARGQMDWQQITSSRLWIVQNIETPRVRDPRHGRQVFGSRPENQVKRSNVSPESDSMRTVSREGAA